MTRLLSGLTLAATAGALIWVLPLAGLLAVALGVGALAFGEYARLAAQMDVRVPWWPALGATLAACAIVPFPWVGLEAVLGAALLVTAAAALRPPARSASVLHDAGAGLLAPLYIGLPLGAMVAAAAVAGREALLLLLLTVVASDTAQYYAGRAFGRRPLAPRLSPKKTIEGAVGGLLAAPAALAAAGSVALPSVPPAALAALGVLVAAAGICGDLFESALKRAAGVKDSGTLIPGHGGVLDRIDALLFAAPVFYTFLSVT